MMKTSTKGTKVRKVGDIRFDELDAEIQTDVVASLAYVLAPWRRSPNPDIQMTSFQEEVLTLLANGPAVLPLVEVSPEAIFDPNRGVSRNVVENYLEAMGEGDDFPPVVIDSSKPPALALLEGGHRTAAAVEAGE